jgi:pyruvate dehydrogenase E1 component alpha subunit
MGQKKWREARPREDYLRILNPDGSVNGAVPQVADEELLRWYRAFIETRLLETLGLRLQRRGVLSVAGTSLGEEACGLGAAAALRPGDWLHPSYRQTSALLYWGVPVDRMMASLLGHAPEHIAQHLPIPPDLAPKVRLTPYPIFLGANVPLATGVAFADKLNNRPNVSLVFIGEGATSEGDFHDGLGLAGVLKLPCVVVVQNNQWSISVPSSRQTAAETFAQKAVAHGLPSHRVDGNDVFAVYAAVQEAVDRARRGEGASVVEAVTYRMMDHNSADSASIYRTDEEVEYWKSLDPLDRFERYLVARGLLDDALKQQVRDEAEPQLRAAISRARAVPPTPPESMFLNHLNGDPGWTFRHQQRECAVELAGGNPFVDFTGEGL